jgi:prevent-host-death family protein
MIANQKQTKGKTMPKSVSASEAKNRLGSIMDWAVENMDEVIIQSYGDPKAVILPYAQYERFVQFREMLRREEALRRLEGLVETVQAQNQDLTSEKADALADRFTREVIEEMIEEGKIKYQKT